ncbi:MAG: hypothetical protein B7C24_04545 [Bacteroidetes bacterium 4572_77]|nr:MAG: hypothetical protein B7C24_04545 [Bacteroidetes bacterium 4572_77]
MSVLFIESAKVVFPNSMEVSNILVVDGVIANIGLEKPPKNAKIIKASNLVLTAGGIDAHVHFNLQTANGLTADDFESGSQAALAGGTLSVIDFITPKAQEDLHLAYEKRIKEVSNAVVNCGFHQSITHWDEHTAEQMKHAVEQDGISSFKTYLAYGKTIGIDAEVLEKVMRQAADLNALVLVHAENGALIDELLESNKSKKKSIAKIHKETHPDETELQAVKTVLALCEKTKCKTYIVHVSTALSMQLIQQAKKNGLPVFAETCPQYFLLNDSLYQGEESKAINYILSPPLRSEENRKGISQAIEKGVVDTISTDHCSFSYAIKHQSDDYDKVPQGIGGVQYRIMLAYTHFVKENKMTWMQMMKLLAENPAQIFSLKNKGKIAVGYDADLVLWQELEEPVFISDLNLKTKSDFVSFENRKTSLLVKMIIKNGVLYE